jgi:imidazolonepropionase-like amidohydrolase
MAVGTDAIYHLLKKLSGMYFEEIELFVKNGYTPMEAIVAATKIGAEVSDAADKLGTIEKGKIADLLVIEGDPLEDIRNLRNVKVIIQDGKIIKR